MSTKADGEVVDTKTGSTPGSAEKNRLQESADDQGHGAKNEAHPKAPGGAGTKRARQQGADASYPETKKNHSATASQKTTRSAETGTQ